MKKSPNDKSPKFIPWMDWTTTRLSDAEIKVMTDHGWKLVSKRGRKVVLSMGEYTK